jgi:Holliday junction resolvase RusA-like endonuclease
MILSRANSHLKIELAGLPPAKKNSRRNFKSGVSLPSVRYELWQKYAVAEISEVWNEEPIQMTSSICLTLGISDKRRKDLDNMLTSVLDMLVHCNVLEDDDWRICSNITVRGLESEEDYTNIQIWE